MPAVFLGDAFSTNSPAFLGKPVASKTLVKAIFQCDEIDTIITVGDPRLYLSLGLGDVVQRKLVVVNSITQLVRVFHERDIAAILCSEFGRKYAQLVHFRNINDLNCPVFGVTHSLSYQDEVGALYRMYCAGVRTNDGILCTSRTAIEVMEQLLDSVQQTISLRCSGPSLHLFPLGYEADRPPQYVVRSRDYFQVLYIGRLDWQTKADLLVLPAVIAALPEGHNIRFVVAGAVNNDAYFRNLQQACAGLPVQFEQNISDVRKQQLFRESHVFFSPSDNYQETFGVSILEAKHHGCVPVVSDFDGYRYLVNDGEDGILLETRAAKVPDLLWKTQILMPDPIYHGWWAAGVSIDPAHAARALAMLAGDPRRFEAIGMKAVESARSYSLAETSRRYGELVIRAKESTASAEHAEQENPVLPNPFQIDYSQMFSTHPTRFWYDDRLALTKRGEQFLQNPSFEYVAQLQLMSGVLGVESVVSMLHMVKQGLAVRDCLDNGVEPIVFSVALKNGLVSLAETQP